MAGLANNWLSISTRKLKATCYALCILVAIVSVVKAQDESCPAGEARGASSYNSIWFVGVLSSLVFAFVGVLPAFFIQSDADEEAFKNSMLFKMLLSFAAGSLLSEVFLHFIPENSGGSQYQQIQNGLISIGSFFVFMLIDKLTNMIPNAHALGILNLTANFFDNSAHGTTIVGAFRSSFWFGFVALIATVVHEVPHEFSDFALLLRDGIGRKNAIILQLVTAFAGSFGATFTHIMTSNFDSPCGVGEAAGLRDHDHAKSGSIVLSFTTGGFLYIVVGIIPEIIEEKNIKASFLQLVSFCFGIILIYGLISIESVLPAMFL